MADLLSPGVYVREVPSSARPIVGVGTSTAAFIGLAAEASAGPQEPQFIANWEDFKRHFGELSAANEFLAHAVYGYLNNGGTSCYVVRVADQAALDDPTAALEVLETYDDIAIVSIPGATSEQQHDAITSHCARLQDRFGILDGVPDADPATPGQIAPKGRSDAGSYVAVYFPWLKVFNPLASPDAADKQVAVPPSGHVAGIFARSDATRGVHKAPANEAILGALDVEQRLSRAHQDQLNPNNVNAIRVFSGTVKVWGARTRSENLEYVSTRRLMNFLRESIEQGTQYTVFEPNDHALWQRIIRSVSNFLFNQWQAGALFGATANEAFFVKCDEETNPPSVRESGQVVIEVGVAITKPAEFVIFRLQQTAGG